MPSTLVLSDVGDETWGAILEDGRVVELHVENRGRPGIAGNIYKGRVSRVLPGMQSAFIDIGQEKDAFLHVTDLPSARGAGGELLSAADDESAVPPEPGAPGRAPQRASMPMVALIQDHLREGQEIVVQVAKEPIAAKGPRVTAQIALPGRVLVYLPSIDQVLVSRRLEDPAERERLAGLAQTARKGTGGWIVRTAAEGATEDVITRDAAYLTDLWASVLEKDRRAAAPALLHEDLNLAERLHRDVVSEEFEEVIVDSGRLEGIATTFMRSYLAGLSVRVRRSSGAGVLLDDLGIHQEIEQVLRPRIWLKSGGSIVVNPTEALITIDVNTGKFVGTHGLEETALITNLEAVCEIVRLLRLRDLGGIIVIDFIDMTGAENREVLSSALSAELKKDRSRSKLLAMSDFGLVQLTRKRTRRSLDRALLIPCPACRGHGRIRSAIALYYEIQRELARGAPIAGERGPVVRLHPAGIARLEEEGLRLSLARSLAEGSPQRGPGRSPARAQPRLEPDPGLDEERFEVRW